MKKILALGFLFLFSVQLYARHKTEYVVIVTLDGMRWQEVFGGVDSALMNNPKFTREEKGMKKNFWSDNTEERRKMLFPFLWNRVAVSGQLYGNRKYNNYVNVANNYWFSYPGYNEIFTGYPDSLVNSNDKKLNANENVLEFLNKQSGFNGKVAAFATWDCFPYILNAKRSGFLVNADVDTLKFQSASLSLINDMQFLTPRPIDVRPDVFTYFAAREYFKAYSPRLLYIAFDETDDFAHAGEYDQYIKSAHAQDAMIADLWNNIQSSPKYADKTTLIVTCDHGRGDKIKETWRDHGRKVEGSNEIWIAAMGPDTKPTGEVKSNGQLYQAQIAATIASILGFDFKANHPVMPLITSITE